jgi:dTMP kinase
VFVTLEGPEGAGKSTAARGLALRLEEAGRQVVLTREPGAGELGAQIRAILLHGGEMPPLSELFLFLADRANHVDRVIRPALERGEVVVCDRFADSTVVYQGHARGLDADQLRRLNALATQGLAPNLTLLFDLPVEVGLRRLTSPDRMDAQPVEFHQRVRDGFLKEAAREPERWRTIDASQKPEAVLDACWRELRSILQ